MSAVADVLDGAADLIEHGPVRWGQALDLSESVVCMSTAPGRVCHQNTPVDVTSHLAMTLGWDPSGSDPIDYIFGWNDTPGRTQAEVVAALRAAAERARG